MDDGKWEEFRSRYKPDPVDVLFIGESRPHSGKFFYQSDSNLYRYTHEAFYEVFQKHWPHNYDFLRGFEKLGCYLDDLCLEPVNNLPKVERNLKRREAVNGLSHRLTHITPKAVIVVMKAIVPNVRLAVRAASLSSVPTWHLPFPAQGHQRRYAQGLIDAIEELRRNGLLLRAY